MGRERGTEALVVLAAVGAGARRKRCEVVAALAEAGFKAVEQPDHAPERAGALVLFDWVADDVRAEVARLSSGGVGLEGNRDRTCGRGSLRTVARGGRDRRLPPCAQEPRRRPPRLAPAL